MRYAKGLYAWNAENPWGLFQINIFVVSRNFKNLFCVAKKQPWWAVCRTALLLSQGMAQSSDSHNIFFFFEKKKNPVE